MINPIFVRTDLQKLALVFKNDPEAGYRFAVALNFAREALGENDRAVIDELIDAIFPFTSFYNACHHLYLMAIKGKLKPQFDPVALAVAADPHWFGRRVKPKPKSKT
jgi:hypothetical protein